MNSDVRVCVLTETKCTELLRRMFCLLDARSFAFYSNWTFDVRKPSRNCFSYTFTILIHLVGYASSPYFLFIRKCSQRIQASSWPSEETTIIFFSANYFCWIGYKFAPHCFRFTLFHFGFQTMPGITVECGPLRNQSHRKVQVND